MARKPENIHVYLYRKSLLGKFEFAVFQRADDPKCWQGISGGVEDGETTIQAALKESFEEAGTPLDSDIYALDTVSYIPADIFSAHTLWGENTVVIPMYYFAIPFSEDIILSDEHIEAKWLEYDDADKLVYWHDQKTALWELNQRLLRKNLVRIS